MLSRRFLRIKIMQSAYAFEVESQAQKELVLDEFGDHFAPDLNSMEPQDKKMLALQKKRASDLFLESYASKSLVRNEDSEIDELVAEKIKGYYKSLDLLRKEKERALKIDIDQIHKSFIFFLTVPTLLEDAIKKRELKEQNMKVSTLGFSESEYSILSNPIIKALAENPFIKQTKERLKVETPDDILIKRVYADCLSNEHYKEYISTDSHTDEEEIGIFKKVIKILFKNNTVSERFDERDIYWKENAAIVSGLCASVTKIAFDQIAEKDLFSTILKEDDKEFWHILFDQALEENRDIDQLITDNIKNWDKDRVTLTDKVIIKMALQEMMKHTSIPIKVTINEYIELSKKYSTPKSKQFVNGILDNLSRQLKAEGKIKKSGRGLMNA